MRKLIVALTFLALLAPGRLDAESLELPIERSLDERANVRELFVRMRHATLEIIVDPQAEPRLRARRRSQPSAGKVPRVPVIEWDDREGSISLTRADGEGQTGAQIPLLIEIVVAAVDRIELRGSDLDLILREPRAIGMAIDRNEQEAGEEPASGNPAGTSAESPIASVAAPAPPRRLDLQVAGSDIRLEGIPGGRLVASGGSLRLVRTSGVFSISTTDTEVEIEGHVGLLELVASQGELWLADHRGELTLELTGGRLVIRDGESHFVGRADGGLVQIEGWQGKGKLEGRGTIIEVRQAGAPETELTLEGRDLQVTIDRYQGTLTATLHGGSLRGGDVVGEADVTALSRAFVDLTGLEGEIRLSLEGGAVARMADVAEKLIAEVKDSRLDVTRVKNLNLLAERAEVYAAELLRLGRAKATDSQLDLDLSRINHHPALILKGSSSARIRLPLPCEVRIVQPGEITEERANVTGCELRTRASQNVRFEAAPRVEGAVKFIASVSEESSLAVKGVPVPVP